jgi:hypothetical protein
MLLLTRGRLRNRAQQEQRDSESTTNVDPRGGTRVEAASKHLDALRARGTVTGWPRPDPACGILGARVRSEAED